MMDFTKIPGITLTKSEKQNDKGKSIPNIYDVSIGIDHSDNKAALYFRANPELSEMVETWLGKALLMMCGEITPEEYDNWRYNFGCAN